MSKPKRASVAAVCALATSAVMVTPAVAVGTGYASYNCGDPTHLIPFRFKRTAPTTPPSKNLTVEGILALSTPLSISVGGVVATLKSPPSPSYPLTTSNPNVIPPGLFAIKVTGPSTVSLSGPPGSITITVAQPGFALNITCTLSATESGWPI